MREEIEFRRRYLVEAVHTTVLNYSEIATEAEKGLAACGLQATSPLVLYLSGGQMLKAAAVGWQVRAQR